MEAPKICVLMWYDDAYKEFSDLCFEMNKKYCSRHGYDLVKSSKRRCPDRTPHYERFPLMYEYLDKGFDYLVWIDADAAFRDGAPSLTRVTQLFAEFDFILSGDLDQGDKGILPPKHTVMDLCKINSGFIIAKCTDYTKETIRHWMTCPRLMKRGHGKFLNWDQGIIRLYILQNIRGFQNHMSVVPFGVLQVFSRQANDDHGRLYEANVALMRSLAIRESLVLHFSGVSNSVRIEGIRKMHQKVFHR